jgi:rSAM/selenodomain-associated transferase 2
VIPARDEALTIASVLRSLSRQDRISACQVIVVDGTSSDDTAAVAGGFPFVQVVTCPPGRAAQLNFGARHALAPVLWFLHADSTFPDTRCVDSLLDALKDPGVAGGAFRFSLRGTDLYYRLVTMMVNLRSAVVKRVYGDQGVFVRTGIFRALGGFRDIGFCEDVDLVLRLRKQGEFLVLPKVVETSARTWQRYGKIRTTIFHLLELTRYEWRRRLGKLELPAPEDTGVLPAPEPGGDSEIRARSDAPATQSGN